MYILDNQEVTSDILNGIAKDLGAADFNRFSDGTKFGVDELNQITAALVTKGVISNGSSDACKVSVGDGKISVATGTIVFDTGAKMKIEEPQLLDTIPNTKTYVVAVNDSLNNRILLYNSESLPEDISDYVILAEVSESGELIDVRGWSVAKVDVLEGPVYEHFQETVECIFAKGHVESLSKTVNLTRSGYHAVYIPNVSKNYNSGKCVFLSLDGAGFETGMKFKGVSDTLLFRLVYDGKSTLKIYSKVDGAYSSNYDYTSPVPFGIYFF